MGIVSKVGSVGIGVWGFSGLFFFKYGELRGVCLHFYTTLANPNAPDT
jgi:hypothetical protein